MGDADSEDHNAAAVLAVAGCQDEAVIPLLCPFPARAVTDAQAGALGETHQALLHFLPRREFGAAVHEFRHDAPVPAIIGEEAVPVVAFEFAGVARIGGVGLRPRKEALEKGESAEHTTRTRIGGDDRVVDAEPVKEIAGLKTTRARTDDDQGIVAGR